MLQLKTTSVKCLSNITVKMELLVNGSHLDIPPSTIIRAVLEQINKVKTLKKIEFAVFRCKCTPLRAKIFKIFE